MGNRRGGKDSLMLKREHGLLCGKRVTSPTQSEIQVHPLSGILKEKKDLEVGNLLKVGNISFFLDKLVLVWFGLVWGPYLAVLWVYF